MTGNKQQIIDLETRFWQSMKDKDVDNRQVTDRDRKDW